MLFLIFRMYTSDLENVARYGGQGKLAMSKSATCKYIQGVHKVLHTLKIFISQKPHKVETLHFRQ